MVNFALVMSIAFMAISLVPLSQFNVNEPFPELQRFTPNKASQFGEDVHVVKTGFYVDDFPGFNMVTNTFILVQNLKSG